MFGDKMFWGLCSGFLYWGFIFGRSGLGVHFRTFGVRTFGVPFSDVRGSFSDVRGSGFIFGRSGFGRWGIEILSRLDSSNKLNFFDTGLSIWI